MDKSHPSTSDSGPVEKSPQRERQTAIKPKVIKKKRIVNLNKTMNDEPSSPVSLQKLDMSAMQVTPMAGMN